jgi:hypothetical protein
MFIHKYHILVYEHPTRYGSMAIDTMDFVGMNIYIFTSYFGVNYRGTGF